MQVTAFATPAHPEWRWRIVSYSGEVIEESRDSFPSIAAAVASGNVRLRAMDDVDRTVAPAWRRSIAPPRRNPR